MFTQVTVAFELDIYGGVFASKSLNTANISLKNKEKGIWFKIVEINACVCLVLSIFGSLTRLQREGLKAFFANLWNWAEMLMISLTLLSIFFYVMRQNIFLLVMEEFSTSRHSVYLDFATVFFWQILFHVTMGMAGAVAILKMLKVTTFNPIWKTFVRSVTIGLSDFQAFLFATAFIILAFCFFGRMIFGSHAKSYSTFSRSMLTLLFFILGEADYETLVAVDLFFGRLFFLTFMFISQYFVLFIFIAIMRDALDIARYMHFEHEQAVIRYIVNTILLYLNALTPQITTSSEKEEPAEK
ncbi:polycystic kidney disease 2-like 2 protein [Elysia marginata]|uniref:Polycystic kidney disease 2-like 2 protein n=1 Tax=Elysia marginata TaxID=1093978 RepID=A0AAV4JZW1_9GAST|nr:polycystic kidney disease 2-like 2 protein [Elysia marginata]